MAVDYRSRDVELGIRPPAAALAAVADAVAKRAPFRFMMTDVKVTDSAVRAVVGKARSAWYADAPYAAAVADAEDADESVSTAVASVLLFGRMDDGPSVCVRVDGYKPWFRVEIPDAWGDLEQRKLVDALNRRFGLNAAAGGGVTHSVDWLKRYYGWVPDPDPRRPWKTRRFRYMQLAFPSATLAQRAARVVQASAAAWVGAELRFFRLPDDDALLAELEPRRARDGKALAPARREALLRVYLARHHQLLLPVADTLQKAATKFGNDFSLGPSGWVTVVGYGAATTDSDARISNCDVEVAVPADAHCLFASLDDVTCSGGAYAPTPALTAWARAYEAAGLTAGRTMSASPLLLSKYVRDWHAKHGAPPGLAPGLTHWAPAPLASLAPLVLASFDGEMYSNDNTFPSVVKGDSTKYIGTNFRVGSGRIVRVMQCVGAVAKPAFASTAAGDGGYDAATDIHVECYGTEREMYEAWRDLIVSVDPDILVSWNGFGFDFPFMHADYMQCFAAVAERCTEGMQQAMRRKARELLLARGVALPAETFDTSPELLARLRSMQDWRDTVAMLTAMGRAHGGKFVKDLLAAEKVVKAAHSALYTKNIFTLFGAEEGRDEPIVAEEARVAVVSAALMAGAAGALAAIDEVDAEAEAEVDDEDKDKDSADDDSGDEDEDGDKKDDDPTAPRFADVDDAVTAATVHMSPLSEAAATEVRQELRTKLKQAAAKFTETTGAALLRAGKPLPRYVTEALAMPAEERVRDLTVLLADLARAGAQDEFLAWVASQRCLGPGVARLLTMPVPPADAPKRGVYLSRLAAEACALYEKKMNSAAKGDNIYNYYAMSGRTPVDLMQIIKDDKKPEDNSLRYAAEAWLDAAKKIEVEDEYTAAVKKARHKKDADSRTRRAAASTDVDAKARALLKANGRTAMRAAAAAVGIPVEKDPRESGSKRRCALETDSSAKRARRLVGDERAAAFLDALGDDDGKGDGKELEADLTAARDAVRTVMAPSPSPAPAPTPVPVPAPAGDKSKAKIDLSAVEMFKLHRQGERDPVKRWPIVYYCARDCEIPLLLIEKLKYVTIWIEMSRVCFTPLEQVVNAGQQVKVFNLISRFVHGEFAVNVRDSGWPTNDAQDGGTGDADESGRNRVSDYQGATVIEPIKGFYVLPISTLDFASLYPSIIRFYNLCPSVLVVDDEYKTWDTHARVTLERHAITHNVVTGWASKPGSSKREPVCVTETRTYTFATHIQGVLPRLLKHLGTCRKTAKKVMEAAEGRAALCKATAAFLHGIALSDPASADAASAELSSLKAGGKPKAGQLKTFTQGLSARGCTPAGLATAEAALHAAAAAAKDTLTRETHEDAAKKLHGTLLETEAFLAALAGVRATGSDSVPVATAVASAIKKAKEAAAKEDLDAAVQNGRQLGIKVSMNSVYGFNGVSADKGLLPCKPVAAVTTLKGRAFIEVAKDYVERTYAGAKVVYGDTDSVMICWNEEISVEEAYRRGGEAAKAITNILRSGGVAGLGGAGYEAKVKADAKTKADAKDDAKDDDAKDGGDDADTSPARDLHDACMAVELTNEKVYGPYLLDKKKRYAGLKWVMNEETGEFVAKLDMKGIDAVRRDRPKFVRETCTQVLNALLYDKSAPKAKAVLAGILEDMLAGRMPAASFVMSKSVRGSYKGGVENLPQVQAWRRMQRRGDDDIPPIGARMPYLIVAPADGSDGGAKSDVKLYERSEHPAHVRASGLTLDLVYYIEQLTNPVCKLVEHVKMEGVRALFAAAADRANAKIKGVRPLTDFMTATGHGEDEDMDFMVHDDDSATYMGKARHAVKPKYLGTHLGTHPGKHIKKEAEPTRVPQRNLMTMLGLSTTT